ncbi:hypothetical protein KX935_06100 [Streptobacillus moniliformis]|uniref:hypothetical protein n=1 Tax=Streptobacillus moniliformis TaxID=34105 RepID=UPI0007E4701C|nr:hypothetical protein [Streptobacillus moniliformis]QXW65366.1 hypothetical protein KX935_06100 [Streptobacillus moniliformis]
MKKLVLSIVLLIGLFSFSFEITGPRYKVDLTLGAGYKPDPHDKETDFMNFTGNFVNIDMGIGFSPEWTLKINRKFGITFGPKITTNLFTTTYESYIENDIHRQLYFSLSTGVRVDFEYTLKNNIKIYTGAEANVTVRPDIHISYSEPGEKGFRYLNLEVHSTAFGKISLGTKIKRYSIGLYTEFGLRKQLVGGIEVGYTF